MNFYGKKVDCNCLPEETTQLIHLKYLGIRNARISYLPPSIVHLQSLQTLDVYSSNSSLNLPIEISKLQELRHLIGEFHGLLPIENLTNLQTLKFASYESWTKVNAEKLVNLRELHINSYSKEEQGFSFHSIAKLKSLRILCVKVLHGNYFYDSLEPLSHCPSLLDLKLKGKMKTLPRDMHALLPNLESLSLEKTSLEDDPMPTLEKLPSLVNLELLSISYCGKKMVCTSKGFPRLENLELVRLDEVEEWQVEGGMQMLKSLVMTKAMNSRLRIPETLKSICVTTRRQ